MASNTTKPAKKASRPATTSPAKRASTKKALSPKKTKPAQHAQKIDYYPNRVALLTAIAAVLIMFSFALASVLLLKY